MKERPIIFSAPMVRALLTGTKTQTRRIAKPVKHPDLGNVYAPGAFVLEREPQHVIERACPYGQPGDRLWVRETWRGVVNIAPPGGRELAVARYVPDQEHCLRVEYAATQAAAGEPWRPSIHMPRWASRVTLQITSIRVERLQDISDGDAIAEGIERQRDGIGWRRGPISGDIPNTATRTAFPRLAYQSLWESINGADSWDTNPWVWVVEFKRVEGGAA